MKEIVVTKCDPDEYYIIDGGDVYGNGSRDTIENVEGKAELFDYKIKEVTRLSVGIDATVYVSVEVEGDEDAALERASEIANAFEQEVDKIVLLGEAHVDLGLHEAIFWHNEDSGEDTYK